MKNERALGDAREAVLCALAHREGVWKDTPSAWRWERSTHWTVELLYSLGARGLVTVKGDEVFELTQEGWQRANRLLGRNLRPRKQEGAHVTPNNRRTSAPWN